MLLGLFRKRKRRIGREELEALRTAEQSLGVSLADTYEVLSERNRAVFLEHAKRYNREHAEYLEMARKYGET